MRTHRLKYLPGNLLGTTLGQAATNLASLKAAPQYIGGSSVVAFTSDTGDTYDWSGVLPQEPGGATGYGSQFFVLTATAENMAVFYGNPLLYMFVGTSTTWYRPSDAMADLIASNFPFESFFFDAPNNDPTITNQKSWTMRIVGDTTRTVFLKIYIQGLDNATFTLTEVT